MLNITDRERKSLLVYFPSTTFSENYIRIPYYRLPGLDYNRQFIDLLIYMPVGAEPQVYVPRDLVCLKGGNHHLDYATEPALAGNWKKLCIRKRWKQEHGLISILNLVTEFLTDLPVKAVTY